MKREEEQKEKKSKKKWLLLLLLLLLLGSCSYYMFKDQVDLLLDPNQSEGELSGLSEDEIKALMEEKVGEGSFLISINTLPKFADGDAKGTMRIVNSKNNHYLMVVKMYLKDSEGKAGELIYESGAIRPGNKIELAALDKHLAKGKYPVITQFEAYQLETKDYVGKAISDMNILIEK